MILKTKVLTIDIINGEFISSDSKAKFYTEDKNNASIIFKLQYKGEPFDVKTSKLKPELNFVHADGSVWTGLDVETNEDGELVFEIPEDMIKHHGLLNVTLVLKNDKQSVHASKFSLRIYNSGIEEAVSKVVNVPLVKDYIADLIKDEPELLLVSDKIVDYVSEKVNTDITDAVKKSELQDLITNKAEVTYVDEKISEISNGGGSAENMELGDNSLSTNMFKDNSVTHAKRTVLGDAVAIAYYQKSIDFNTVDGTITIAKNTRFRSGFHEKLLSDDVILETNGHGSFLVWDVEKDEFVLVRHTYPNKSYNENMVFIASVGYPKNKDLIKVEGINNYTIDKKSPFASSSSSSEPTPTGDVSFLMRTGHVITGFATTFDLNTETHQFKIPKQTVVRSGHYMFKTDSDVFIDVKDGYNLIYLDTDTNTFLRVPYNYGESFYKDSYLYICGVQIHSKYPEFNSVQGVNDYTIDGVKGYLSEFENDLDLETIKYSLDHPLLTPRKPRLIGHRGLSGLKPENTIPSFEECGIQGIFGVETDIRTTKDGHFVCLHDETVDRTTNGTGLISELTLEEVRNLNITSGKDIENHPNLKIPTLEELLFTCGKYGLVPLLDLYLESKYIPELVERVNELGFENSVIYGHRSIPELEKISKMSNSIVLQISGAKTKMDNVKKPTFSNFGIDVDVEVFANYPNAIKDHHKHRMIAAGWTVNDKETAIELFEQGIDLITTDKLTSVY